LYSVRIYTMYYLSCVRIYTVYVFIQCTYLYSVLFVQCTYLYSVRIYTVYYLLAFNIRIADTSLVVSQICHLHWELYHLRTLYDLNDTIMYLGWIIKDLTSV